MNDQMTALSPDQVNQSVAGAAALSICESLLIALNDLDVIGDTDARAVLSDAIETHRQAIPTSADPQTHRAVADLIEKIMNGKNSVRKL